MINIIEVQTPELTPEFVIETERNYYEYYHTEIPDSIPDYIENSEGDLEPVLSLSILNPDGSYNRYTP